MTLPKYIELEPVWYLRSSGSYTMSRYWKDFRGQIVAARGERCEACGLENIGTTEWMPPILILHHLHYDTVGREGPDDVVLVCEPCHNAIHSLEPDTRRSPEQRAAADYWLSINDDALRASLLTLLPTRGRSVEVAS